MNNPIQPHKSSIGDLQANSMALLCYLAGCILAFIPVIRYVAWLAPLAIFFLEKESRFVKFHAMQAFVLDAIGRILGLLLTLLFGGNLAAPAFYSYGTVGFIVMLTTLISLVSLALAVIAMLKAYKYVEYRIPIIGNIAAGLLLKAK